jgi:hypothetical protein
LSFLKRLSKKHKAKPKAVPEVKEIKGLCEKCQFLLPNNECEKGHLVIRARKIVCAGFQEAR